MYNSRASNQPPSASIRAGLSVQELKAMTAMRMATNEPNRGGKIAPMNAANSYQTATPEQLQAAGIQHVALNSQAARNSKLSPAYGLPNRNDDGFAYGRNSMQNPSSLSPYHQQILSGSNKTIPPIQSVQELKALTQMTAQRSSRAQLVLHGGNPSSQYASAISTQRPVRPNGNLQPLYGDYPAEDMSKYTQQQLNEAAKRQNSFRISSIPVTTNTSNSDDEESDFALNQMLADYERRDRSNNSGGSTKLSLDNADLTIALGGVVAKGSDSYSALFSPSSQGSDPEPLTPTNRSARNSGFSESFNGLSVNDRDAAIRQQQQQTSYGAPMPAVGTRPVKLGMISKSQSQPLIPLGGANSSSPVPFGSPVPGRKGPPPVVARTFLPELDSNSPHTSRETTPKLMSIGGGAVTSPNSGLFPSPSEPALTSVSSNGGNGMFPMIKSRSQTRITGAGSPFDVSGSSRRNSTQEDGGLNNSNEGFGTDMAESVLDFLNSTPTPTVSGHKTFNFTKDVNEFRQQRGANRGGDMGFTVSDLMTYTDHNHNHTSAANDMNKDFDDFVMQHNNCSADFHHHNNNEDDDAIRFDMVSRQSSNSEMAFNTFSPRYSSFE